MSGELGAWRSPHTGALRMTRAQAEQLGRRALYLLIAIEAGEIDAQGCSLVSLLGGKTQCTLARAILGGEATP